MANHEFDSVYETGVLYQFSLDGSPLYEGVFLTLQGCWGRVQVQKVIAGADAKYYKPNDQFEVKVAMYGIKKV